MFFFLKRGRIPIFTINHHFQDLQTTSKNKTINTQNNKQKLNEKYQWNFLEKYFNTFLEQMIQQRKMRQKRIETTRTN